MTSRLCCFLDIEIDGSEVGRIVFELYNDICPRRCENFRCLCTGEKDDDLTSYKKLCYKECIFHRVVKHSMIQSGDISGGSDAGEDSIYGGAFADENLQMKHDRPYLLSMVNRGPNTNGSQFFITTSEASHLDGKHVIFGHVVSGQSVVNTIENMPVDSSNRPWKNVVISHCGQLVSVPESNKGKKRKNSTVDEGEDEQRTERDLLSDEHKKKKEHKREKEAKHLAKHAMEEKNTPDQSTNNIAEKTNELSGRDIMQFKVITDHDETPEIPKDKFVMRHDLNDNNTNNEISSTHSSNYRSSEKIDSSGRRFKGRGFMKYKGESRSRSRTPHHLHSAVENRECFSDVNAPRWQDQTETTSWHQHQRSSGNPDDHRSINIKNQELGSSNITQKYLASSHRHSSARVHSPSPTYHQEPGSPNITQKHLASSHRHSSARVRSPSPTYHQEPGSSNITQKHLASSHRHSSARVRSPSPTYHQEQIKDSGLRQRYSKSSVSSPSRVRSPLPPVVIHHEINKSQSHQPEEINTVRANQARSQSRKRPERQILEQAAQHTTLDNELYLIAQTNAAQLQPSNRFINNSQQSHVSTTINKLKRNDEDDISIQKMVNPAKMTSNIFQKAEIPLPINKQQNKPLSSGNRQKNKSSGDRNKERLKFGQIYYIKSNICEILDSCSDITSSSSSSKSTTSSKKKRTCIIWSTAPELQVIVMTRLDNVTVNDPNIRFHCSLTNQFILKRLIPIHPKPSFNSRVPLITITKPNHSRKITNQYLLLHLIPIKENELMELVDEWFSQEDLLYINSFLVRIGLDEIGKKGEEMEKQIKKSNYPSLNVNVFEYDDNHDYSSPSYGIPYTRCLIDDQFNKNDQIRLWLDQPSFDNDVLENINISLPLSMSSI